ncbi:hypothetical protein PIB19_22320 [Sphingomonas sp. 7/4-4]|uniref:hypothetical protein n=1 Tax=Sphingomonas sp. 7/4-4 TaxID=3018446 RepID=UPI0022F3A3EC|nr:hypothetical protein [Sphingomonas sp. 7/4-4]WBY07944.1 hypothetical protein PIB19_22320 [Sphingomonas sp. 7/4-4]
MRPATSQPVLRALYADASWDAVQISDLSISGTDESSGVGFTCGEEAYKRLDEYVGRTIFQRVGWSGLSTSIARPYGNIGLVVDDCTFADADYHLWTRSNQAPGDPMHGGVVKMRRSRFIGFRKAMFYIDSTNAPGGQIDFEDCVIENAPGFPFYIRGFDGADSTPCIRVARTWNESTAQGQDIEVEG